MRFMQSHYRAYLWPKFMLFAGLKLLWRLMSTLPLVVLDLRDAAAVLHVTRV